MSNAGQRYLQTVSRRVGRGDWLVISENSANLRLAETWQPLNSFGANFFVRRQLGKTTGVIEWHIEPALSGAPGAGAVKTMEIKDDGRNCDQPQIDNVFGAHISKQMSKWDAPRGNAGKRANSPLTPALSPQGEREKTRGLS